MGTELLRDHDLEGVVQNCVKLDCSCGAVKIFPFHRMKAKERLACPECGCISTFNAMWLDKIEKEFAS